MAIITNDTSPTVSSNASELSLLERVASLDDVIRRGGDEAQQLRRCPSFVIDALIDAGLFRFTIPRELGGEDASVGQTIEVIEAISAIDASVGWNVMLGSEINAMAAGGMAKELAAEVYLGDPNVIMCGGGGPGTTPSRAVEQPDGSYRVWAHTTFISGCHNATWCFMVAPVFDGDELRLTNGAPTVKLWMLHRDQWEILDTWDVAGLRGSGSHDVVTEGGIVPARFADVDLVTVPPLYENPVYRIPVPLRLAYNKAAVAIGVARGALDEFAVLANAKTPMLSSTPLRDRPVAQYRMGEGEATLRARRGHSCSRRWVRSKTSCGPAATRRPPNGRRSPGWRAPTRRTRRCRSSTRSTMPPARRRSGWTARSNASCEMLTAARPIAGWPIRSTPSWGRSSSATKRRQSSPARVGPHRAPVVEPGNDVVSSGRHG